MDPLKTTRLIGSRWKHSNVLSRGVLIDSKDIIKKLYCVHHTKNNRIKNVTLCAVELPPAQLSWARLAHICGRLPPAERDCDLQASHVAAGQIGNIPIYPVANLKFY